MNPSPNNARWLVPCLCLFIAGIIWAVFGQTVHYGFVNFDDDVYVYNNPHVAGGLTWKSVAWAFTHVHSSNWHPVTWLSHMLDCQWHGLQPGWHHATNVGLHALTAILLFLVLHQMTGLLWRCALVAALFAIHPLRVESVAWIAERKDVLSGFFFMLTLAAYFQYVRTPRKIAWYLATALMMAFALMSKPMVVTLPIVLLLLDYWPLKRVAENSGGGFPWRLLLEKIPLIAMSVAVCLITVFAQKDAMSAPPLFLRLGNAVVSYAIYFEQMVWPANLAVLYPFPDQGLPLVAVSLAATSLLAISGLAIAFRHRQPWLLFGWLWYLVMLLPVIGILQVGGQAHADRYTYLPQIGLYIALGWLAAEVCARWQPGRLMLGGSAAVMLFVLMFCAHAQTKCWRDSESLWTHTLACTSRNAIAEINYGNALLERKEVDQALFEYQAALQIKPDDADANVSLAYALIQKGKNDAAYGYLTRALELKPDCPEAHNDLGIIFSERGDPSEAIRHFEAALKTWPAYADACYNYGNALFKQGKMDAAVARYQQALAIKPDYAEAAFNLGNAKFQQAKIDEAIGAYQTALRIRPDYFNAAFNLAMAFLQKGKVDEAMVQFEKALTINPDSAEAHYNLGSALLQKRKEAEAVAHFRQALKIKPGYAVAINDLAWELATAANASVRNGKEAVELAQEANQLAGGADPDVLDTLAAAYAEAGSFEQAVENIRKAGELARANAQPEKLAQFNREMELYKAAQAFHQELK